MNQKATILTFVMVVGVGFFLAMAEASAALGLSYYFIPVSPRGLTQENVDDMQAALVATSGPVFAYCRSGNRSGILLQAATQGGS